MKRKTFETYDPVIVALGGNAEVMRIFGVSAQVINNWHRRGIPWRLRQTAASLMAVRGKEVPAGFFTPPLSPPKSKESAR